MRTERVHEISFGHVTWFFTDETLLYLDHSELEHYFDRVYIHKEGFNLKIAGGRGQTLLYSLHDKDLVLRHYYRGGLWGKLMGDKFWALTGDSERSLLELELLDLLYEDGLPVPKPFIARQERRGSFLHNDIVIYQIKESRDLSYILKERALTEQELVTIGKTLKRFFGYDVVHTDLNIHNILLNNEGEVFLIDFDKCRQTLLRQAHKDAMLSRLERSFNKEMRLNPQLHFKASDFALIKEHALSA